MGVCHAAERRLDCLHAAYHNANHNDGMKPPHGQRLARIRAALADGRPVSHRTLAMVAGYDNTHDVIPLLCYLRRVGQAVRVSKADLGRYAKRPSMWVAKTFIK